MQIPEEGQHWRLLARSAWRVAKGNLEKAVTVFNTLCGEHRHDHPSRFVQRWGPSKNTQNAPGQGRKPLISQDKAKKLAAVYKRGFTTVGQHRGFRGVPHAKQKRRKTFASIVQQCGKPCDRTVRSAMRHADPNLVMVRQVAKKQLTERNKKQRKRAADHNLRAGIKRLRATTWLDELDMVSQLPSTKVAGDKRKRDTIVEDPFQAKKFRDRPHVHALLAVNYAVGPLHIEFLTGTSGGVGKDYRVTCDAVCRFAIGQWLVYIMKGCPSCCVHLSTASMKYVSKSAMSM